MSVRRASAEYERHGMSGTGEYRSWQAMIVRCSNPKHPAYSSYGGAGIRVCERWGRSFVNFLADLGPRPSPAHSVDRIDNSRGYEPGNCRWATTREQSRNRRNNRREVAFGREQCVVDWASEFGIGESTLRERLRMGWDLETALAMPCLPRGKSGRGGVISGCNRKLHDGDVRVAQMLIESKTASEDDVAKSLGVTTRTLRGRLRRGTRSTTCAQRRSGLSEAQCVNAMILVKLGADQRSIGRWFGVSKSQVGSASRGEVARHRLLT